MFGIGGMRPTKGKAVVLEANNNEKIVTKSKTTETPLAAENAEPLALSEEAIERLFALMQQFPRGCTAQHLFKLYAEINEGEALPANWLYLLRESGEFVVTGCVVKLTQKKLKEPVQPPEKKENDTSAKPPHLNANAIAFQPMTPPKTPLKSASKPKTTPDATKKSVTFPLDASRLTDVRTMTPLPSPSGDEAGRDRQLDRRLLLARTPIEQLGMHVTYECIEMGDIGEMMISAMGTSSSSIMYVQSASQTQQFHALSAELCENYCGHGFDAAKLSRNVASEDMLSGAIFVCHLPSSSPNWQRVLLLAMKDGALVYAFDSGRQMCVEPGTLRYITPDTLDTPALCYTCKAADDSQIPAFHEAFNGSKSICVECLDHSDAAGRRFSHIGISAQSTRAFIDERSTDAPPSMALSPMALDVSASSNTVRVIVVGALDPHALCLQLATVQPAPAIVDESMRRMYERSDAPTQSAALFSPGDFVCVRTHGARFERGYIAKVLTNATTNDEHSTYKVWLVDRGLATIVEHARVRVLANEALAARNFFGVRATLSTIRPSTSAGWSSETVDALRLAVQVSDECTHEEYEFRVDRITTLTENGAPHIPHVFGDLLDKKGRSISRFLVDKALALDVE